MKAQLYTFDSRNELNKRLFHLLLQLQIDLEQYKAKDNRYEQELQSEIATLEVMIELMMQRLLI